MLAVLGLILANGVFAGAEIAVVSLRSTQVGQLAEKGRAGAAALVALRGKPERFLATVQIGVTVVGTTAAAFGGARLARHLEPLLAGLPVVGPHAQKAALAGVIAAVAYLSLVLGELVPKSLALRVGESYALLIARPLLALSWLAKPIVWFLTASSNLVLRPFSDRTNFVEGRISKEELQSMVDEAARTGTVHEDASEIAARALQFDKLFLRDVMIPRDRIAALPIHATEPQLRQFLLKDRRSRIPVYQDTLDNMVGYISAKDLFPLLWQGRIGDLAALARPIKIFPETMPAIEVLRFMQNEHQRIGVAVDEHGVVSGMVTFEDLVEELVGDVFSEHEEHRQAITAAADGTAVVRGDTPLRDVNRELDLALPETEGATTMAGLCTRLAGGIPHRNARLAAPDGTVLVVLDASPRSVRRVQIIPASPPENGNGNGNRQDPEGHDG